MFVHLRKKIHTAAAATHPLTIRLLHILLPVVLVFLCYAPVRYLFFEPHIFGICVTYREIFEYALLCVGIVIGGALLIEVALNDRQKE